METQDSNLELLVPQPRFLQTFVSFGLKELSFRNAVNISAEAAVNALFTSIVQINKVYE